MTYEFQTSQQDDVFVARIGGERHARPVDDFNELWEFWTRVASEMKRGGVRKLLAIVEPRGNLRSLDVREFYGRLSEMGFVSSMRLAVVHVPNHESTVVRIGVTVAEQDGWDIHMFEAEADAREWLSRQD